MIQTEIDIDQSSETREEQPRSNEKNDCQGHLCNDECCAKCFRTSAARSRTLALTERTRNCRTRELRYRRQTEGDARQNSDDPRDGKHSQVDSDRGRARDLCRYGGSQDINSPPGQHRAKCRSCQGQYQTLQQQDT